MRGDEAALRMSVRNVLKGPRPAVPADTASSRPVLTPRRSERDASRLPPTPAPHLPVLWRRWPRLQSPETRGSEASRNVRLPFSVWESGLGEEGQPVPPTPSAAHLSQPPVTKGLQKHCSNDNTDSLHGVHHFHMPAHLSPSRLRQTQAALLPCSRWVHADFFLM